MFNLQGSEIIFILLIALVVLGPEKLPGAIRRVTSLYAELRKLSSGFQDEFKSVLDEPLREMKSTADLMKNAADPKRIFEEAEREAELDAAAEKKAKQARDNVAAMEAAGAAHLAQAVARPETSEPGVDAFADPVDPAGDDNGAEDDSESVDDTVTVDEAAPVDDIEPEPDDDIETEPEVEPVTTESADDDAAHDLSSTELDFEPEEKSA